MKKALVLLCTLALLPITAINAEENPNQKQIDEIENQINAKEKEIEELKNQLKELMDDGENNFFNTWHEFDTFKIRFTGGRIADDIDGNPALILVYDWENIGEEDLSPFTSFSLKGFQDGVQTDPFIVVMEANNGEGLKEVKTGGKITGAETTISITNINKPLDIELDKAISFNSNTVIATTLDLSQFLE